MNKHSLLYVVILALGLSFSATSNSYGQILNANKGFWICMKDTGTNNYMFTHTSEEATADTCTYSKWKFNAQYLHKVIAYNCHKANLPVEQSFFQLKYSMMNMFDVQYLMIGDDKKIYCIFQIEGFREGKNKFEEKMAVKLIYNSKEITWLTEQDDTMGASMALDKRVIKR